MLTIDPPTGEIVGPAGRERVDPKVMAVMRLLAEHAGELVTREQLLQEIWPSVAITDDAVSRCIYHLRQHLCRASGDSRYKAALDRAPGAIVDLQDAANISPLVAALRADERWRPWLDRLEMASAKVPLLARSKHAPARSESR